MIAGARTPQMHHRIAALVASASALLYSMSARANPLDMYGFGARNVAMASAMSAAANDGAANYYNPAGLLLARSTRIDIGYQYAVNTLLSNGHDNQVDPVHGLSAAMVLPSRVFGLPFAFGFALYLPDDRLARSRLLAQQQPRWELYENRVQRLYFAANLAFAPVPWLRFGGGVSYIASTRGRLAVSGEIDVARPANSVLQHSIDADVYTVYYPQAGVQVDVLPNLTFGIVYRGEFTFRLDLDANVDVLGVTGNPRDPANRDTPRYPGTIRLSERAATAFLPAQGVLGAAWTPIPALTLVADLTYVNWSRYVNPTANLDVTVRFDIPPALNIQAPVVPRPDVVQEPRFRDTLVPRFGVEWRRPVRIHELALRAGYRYDASPVPEQVARETNFMDSTRHVLSAGAGMRFQLPGSSTRSLRADIVFDLQILEPRTVRKDDPADIVGDYRLSGYVTNIGVTLGSTF